MIDTADHQTLDLFPVKRSRGRPVTGKAQSDAERARAYRLRKKQNQSLDLTPEARAARATELLARFIVELGDYATVMPSEEWVADVRAYFGIQI